MERPHYSNVKPKRRRTCQVNWPASNGRRIVCGQPAVSHRFDPGKRLGCYLCTDHLVLCLERDDRNRRAAIPVNPGAG